MNYDVTWLREIGEGKSPKVDGLVDVRTYRKADLKPEEVAVMERAERYGASAVFFKAEAEGRPSTAQVFVFVSDRLGRDEFAQRHKQLWSWGGVPLAYYVEPGVVRLFRCAHDPDFQSGRGVRFNAFRMLDTVAGVANDPWWSKERLRNGSLWDDAGVAKDLLKDGASQKVLIEEVKRLYRDVRMSHALPEALGRKLLILSLLIAYLEARGVLRADYFNRWVPGATEFFEVLRDGPNLVRMLEDLEQRFNGNVFDLSEEDRDTLRHSDQLLRFAALIEAKETSTTQRTLWARYSFADLPVELISQTYQLFVKDPGTAVYTPQALVRLMVGEVLSWERIDRLHERGEVILDPACGSGVFLVEAYKRLVLHWRSRHDWGVPNENELRRLLECVRGIDWDEGAVELASFSLCLALCDALEPEALRATVSLFPKLIDRTILQSDFFEALEQSAIGVKVGIVLGNPPFQSKIHGEAGQRFSGRYGKGKAGIPDNQVAYLFLHESMKLLEDGGVLSMLQGANFLYNKYSKAFRRKFFESWDVREVLDFISVRGMFKGGEADPKVIVVVAEASPPFEGRSVLHATFRRTYRAKARQGFDLDYYDMHWMSPRVISENDGIWRSNLFGGGRVLGFVDRLRRLPTLKSFAEGRAGWDCGEGYITGTPRRATRTDHIVGKAFLPSAALLKSGVDRERITVARDEPIEEPRRELLFTPPMVLIDEQFDLNHGFWGEYLTYKDQIVGIRGPREDEAEVRSVEAFLAREKKALQAYAAATSIKLFNRHSTTLSGSDVYNLPCPPDGALGLRPHDQVVVDDVVDYYRDLIRFGDDSGVMIQVTKAEVEKFSEVFLRQFNAVYKESPLAAGEWYEWPKAGIACQPFVFGDGVVDWSDAEGLWEKLGDLPYERRGDLGITRVTRIYDGSCIYLLKPNRLRYWLRSTALRDADEVWPTFGTLGTDGTTMLADSVPTAPSVAVASDVLRKGEQRYALLDFIAEQLPCWRAADAAVLEQAEDRLTMQLSDFLEEAADGSDVWNRVRFKTQRPDAVNKKGTLDIVAKPVGTIIFAERTYTRRAVLLAIECKRLPAPKPKAREKEYVTSIKGATGGIQRFKLGKHAADHNLAAIIGYVQKGQPADWIATINGWITALASVSSSGWTNDDCLVLDEDGGELCRLTSRHDRGAGKVRIELRHLWIQLN